MDSVSVKEATTVFAVVSLANRRSQPTSPDTCHADVDEKSYEPADGGSSNVHRPLAASDEMARVARVMPIPMIDALPLKTPSESGGEKRSTDPVASAVGVPTVT